MQKKNLKSPPAKISEPGAQGSTPPKNGWGGKRAGAGRRPSQLHREVYHLRDKYKITPLDYFLMVLNGLVPEDDGSGNPKKDGKGNVIYVKFSHAEKMDAAKSASPFMHVRLASVEVTSSDGASTKHSFDLSKLSDEELQMFERIAAKAQTVTLDESDIIDVTPNREEQQ